MVLAARLTATLARNEKRRSIAVFAAVAVFFCLVTWLYMGQALTECNKVILTNVPGDSTAGLTWLTWVDKSHIVPGMTYLTNAPFGENLSQPFQITSAFTIPAMWLLAKMSSPTCAWNLMVFFGYMASALAMFAFVRWLLRNSYVALFAAFAVTYTPYHQQNALGHLDYVLSFIFVLFIWAFLIFWRRPTLKNAALAATATAACFYMDGYFILLEAVLAGSTIFAALALDLIVNKIGKHQIGAKLKGLLWYVICVIVLSSPLLMVKLTYGSQISAVLSSSRGQIINEANTYSARLIEYVMPAADDPMLPHSYFNWRTSNYQIHGSNLTESTLYVGAIVLLLACYCWYFLIRNKEQETLKSYTAIWLASVFTTCVLIAMAMSFPPKILLGHHLIPMPSDIVIHVTSMWRVFARLYLVVETCLVILATLGLYFLVRKSSARRQIIVTLVVIILTGLDFASGARATVIHWSDMPAVYTWLSRQTQIKLIAEYPMVVPPSPAIEDYLTYQLISHKAIVNTQSSDSPERGLEESIQGLADPQTLPVLRALGAQLVLQHHKSLGKVNGLTLLREDDAKFKLATGQPYDKVWTYSINPGPIANYAVEAYQGFDDTVTDPNLRSIIGMGDLGVLRLMHLAGPSRTLVPVQFSADSVRGDKYLTISQRRSVLWQGWVTSGTLIKFNANPNYSIDIVPKQKNPYQTIQVFGLQSPQ